MGNYANIERETTISFNNEEKTAQIYTCQTIMQRKLQSLAWEFPDLVTVLKNYEDKDGLIITIPKGWIKIRKPNTMSDENKEKARDRAKLHLNKAQGFKHVNYAEMEQLCK